MDDDAQRQSVKRILMASLRVPWAKDATLRTPLNPAGGETALIRSRETILAFFNSILPAVRSLKFLRYYTSDGGWVAGQAELSLANGKTAIRARRILR